MIDADLRNKRPAVETPGWISYGMSSMTNKARKRMEEFGIGGTLVSQVFIREQLRVISAVEMVEDEETRLVLPHYHVSVSALDGDAPRVATDEEMEQVRAAFDMGGAEEDNHGPGVVRHLWLKVGQDAQPECPCKQDEAPIVEGDRVRHDREEDV